MFDENQIAERLTDQFGDRFSDLLKQHGSLWAVWRECLDMELMKWMLRASPYGQSYFHELCELVRSLDKSRIAAGLDPLYEAIASEKIVLEERYAKVTNREEIVAQYLWSLAWALIDKWTVDARFDAMRKAIWGAGRPKSKSELDVYEVSIRKSLRQEQAKRLRELIHDPFLPNMAQAEARYA